jgi:cellobiose phosphorylase
MHYAVVNWMLGARAEVDALVLDPCIPSHWRRYQVIRPYHGSTLHITVENPHGKNKGIQRVRIDGRLVDGNRIPAPDKPHVEIRATIQ